MKTNRSDVILHFDGNKNLVLDKDNNVAKWYDARRGVIYMWWQRVKYNIKNK